VSRGWSVCGEWSEERAGEHMWYGDGGICEAVRTGQGKEVGVSEAIVADA